MFSGLVTVINAQQQSASSYYTVTVRIAIISIAIGIGVFFLPWERFARSSTLLLVPIGLALIASGNYLGSGSPYEFGVFFVVVFAWVGLHHPRWTSVAVGLPAAAFYVAADPAPSPHGRRRPVASAPPSPSSVFVGELLARSVAELQRARAVEQAGRGHPRRGLAAPMS